MHACYHVGMEQMTWRAPADLIERVRRAARRQRRSMNDYVTAVLDAATNPGLAGREAERLRERLDQVGLLAEPGERRTRPKPEETAGARRRAGVGTELSQLISEDR
jgi:single-stranded DNA-specific DHH superfamily exonuclease